jgi:pimeloyl-ACP methyl ester carboxylesterase
MKRVRTTDALPFELAGFGPHVALLHDSLLSARGLRPLADLMSVDHEVVTLHLPGHGRASSVVADTDRTADLAANTAGAAIWFGHGWGARIALKLALDRPELVRCLVLVAPEVGFSGAARVERQRRDEQLAARLVANGPDEALPTWLDRYDNEVRHAQFEASVQDNGRYGMATSLCVAGLGSNEPLASRLGDVDAPTLVIAGGNDREAMARADIVHSLIGINATSVSVPGAAGAPHLTLPKETTACVRGWALAAIR